MYNNRWDKWKYERGIKLIEVDGQLFDWDTAEV
jgi:hypothetical protein